MSEDKTDGPIDLTTVWAAAKDEFEKMAKELLQDAAGDISAYATLLAQEFGRYLWRQYRSGDKDAARNIVHLKAQVRIIAAKRSVAAHHKLMDDLELKLEAAARIGVRVLISAAVAAL